ncbi:hypothetical protein, partial [Paraburkholderia phenoliruptrix]
MDLLSPEPLQHMPAREDISSTRGLYLVDAEKRCYVVQVSIRTRVAEGIVNEPETVGPIIPCSARIGKAFQDCFNLESGLCFSDHHSPSRIEMRASPSTNVVDQSHRSISPVKGNVPQTVEGWDGGCGIDYATLRSWSMLDFEGERFRA